MGVPDFLTFSGSPLEVRPRNRFWRKMAQTTCSKNRNFSYPLISRAPKRSKFCKFLDLENFRLRKFSLDLAFNIRGPERENTPYSSSEPNESDIVNRQSGGEKLKYVLKFYIGGTHHVISRMPNDDLALCIWAHDVWGGISLNRYR